MEMTQDTIYEMAPNAKTLGIEFTLLTATEVHARLVNQPGLSSAHGVLHGGVVMGLSDHAGAVCGGLNLDGGVGWSTIESTTHFLRALRGESATAIAKPVKVGRNLINVEIDVFDDADRHCARTSQVLLIQSANGG